MGIFCHAKLDYFYGAIYSTKFTTTLAGSAIFLKANVRANVRRGPNTMKICGRVWGLFEPPRDGSSHRLDLGSTRARLFFRKDHPGKYQMWVPNEKIKIFWKCLRGYSSHPQPQPHIFWASTTHNGCCCC